MSRQSEYGKVPWFGSAGALVFGEGAEFERRSAGWSILDNNLEARISSISALARIRVDPDTTFHYNHSLVSVLSTEEEIATHAPIGRKYVAPQRL